jgi:hypothetical protein
MNNIISTAIGHQVYSGGISAITYELLSFFALIGIDKFANPSGLQCPLPAHITAMQNNFII